MNSHNQCDVHTDCKTLEHDELLKIGMEESLRRQVMRFFYVSVYLYAISFIGTDLQV